MKKKYDTKGMKETCLNCGKKSCALAGVGNKAGVNENNGCWVPKKNKEKVFFVEDDIIARKDIEGSKRCNPADCPFCCIGQYNRNLMFRIVGKLSRGQLKNLRDKLKAEGVIK